MKETILTKVLLGVVTGLTTAMILKHYFKKEKGEK